MTDEMSNKQFCRVRSNAQAEAGLEHRKLREEIERLRALVETAYEEGWKDAASDESLGWYSDWIDSEACDALIDSPKRQS